MKRRRLASRGLFHLRHCPLTIERKALTHASAGIDGLGTVRWECWDWCECLLELLGVFTSWLRLYQGLIPQASPLQPSIFCDHTSSRSLPEEAPLSFFPVLIPFNSSAASALISPFFPLSPKSILTPSCSTTHNPSFLSSPFSSSIWPHTRTKSPFCQAARRDRGSCELERSEINKARTGWMIYPEKMHFVTRMGTAGHKSCHPGCLPGHACWSSSSLSSSPLREQRTHCKQLRQGSHHRQRNR